MQSCCEFLRQRTRKIIKNKRTNDPAGLGGMAEGLQWRRFKFKLSHGSHERLHGFVCAPAWPNNGSRRLNSSHNCIPLLSTPTSNLIGSLCARVSLWATCILATDCCCVFMLTPTPTRTLATKGNFLCAQPLEARRLALRPHPLRRMLLNGSNPLYSGWYI